MNSLDNVIPGYAGMSIDEKRTATSSLFGMTWDEYSKIPADVRVSMLMHAQGYTTGSVADDILKAAQSDIMSAKVGGIFTGLKVGSTGLIVAAVVAVALWFYVGRK